MSMDRMGLTATDERMHECDGCLSTVTCRPSELRSWGWRSHNGGTGIGQWKLLLCDECEGKSAAKATA